MMKKSKSTVSARAGVPGKPAYGAQHPTKVKAAGGIVRTPTKVKGVVAVAKPKAKEMSPEKRAMAYQASKKKS